MNFLTKIKIITFSLMIFISNVSAFSFSFPITTGNHTTIYSSEGICTSYVNGYLNGMATNYFFPNGITGTSNTICGTITNYSFSNSITGTSYTYGGPIAIYSFSNGVNGTAYADHKSNSLPLEIIASAVLKKKQNTYNIVTGSNPIRHTKLINIPL